MNLNSTATWQPPVDVNVSMLPLVTYSVKAGEFIRRMKPVPGCQDINELECHIGVFGKNEWYYDEIDKGVVEVTASILGDTSEPSFAKQNLLVEALMGPGVLQINSTGTSSISGEIIYPLTPYVRQDNKEPMRMNDDDLNLYEMKTYLYLRLRGDDVIQDQLTRRSSETLFHFEDLQPDTKYIIDMHRKYGGTPKKETKTTTIEVETNSETTSELTRGKVEKPTADVVFLLVLVVLVYVSFVVVSFVTVLVYRWWRKQSQRDKITIKNVNNKLSMLRKTYGAEPQHKEVYKEIFDELTNRKNLPSTSADNHHTQTFEKDELRDVNLITMEKRGTESVCNSKIGTSSSASDAFFTASHTSSTVTDSVTYTTIQFQTSHYLRLDPAVNLISAQCKSVNTSHEQGGILVTPPLECTDYIKWGPPKPSTKELPTNEAAVSAGYVPMKLHHNLVTVCHNYHHGETIEPVSDSFGISNHHTHNI
ncbi:uncharacterized protein LOC117113523 [Anneissia japonica]|uniref:uncharacterized protein LOC117113523 n=1 Tax=Anneissia japonica TaxID=1529436 RepID=UPI0014258925|nr:uncharacterized protein LOC117113523 [Anneissia japonica]